MSSTPTLVAEIGANHGGSLARLLATVDAAKASGADAIKLQTWKSMCVSDYVIDGGPWAGRGLRDLYREAQTPWEWHADVVRHCGQIGMAWWSTPFDAESVDFLETLGCSRYKIASFELIDLDLIAAAARTGKPLILSTGMATWDELNEAVSAAWRNGCVDLTLLKCTSAYPAPAQHMNLRTLEHMRESFECKVGVSDHTLGSAVAVAAVALGADMVEKHFALERSGPDAGFSMLPDEFGQMANACRQAFASLGRVSYRPSPSEAEQRKLRRSLYAGADLPAGHLLARGDWVSARPALGLAPSTPMLGRRLLRDVKAGEPMCEDMLE